MKKLKTSFATITLIFSFLAFAACTVSVDLDEEEDIEKLVEEKEEEYKEEKKTDTTETDEVSVTPSITITSPSNYSIFTFDDSPIEFYGTVSSNFEKIVVTAEFTEYEYFAGEYILEEREDVYTLTNFNPGDTSFVYRASVEWDNLGIGDNYYTFTAYTKDGLSISTNRTIKYQAEEYQ